MNDHVAVLLSRVVWTCFALTWIGLGILGFVVFTLPRDVTLKRKWFPRFVISAGVLFLLFSATLEVLRWRTLYALRGLVVVVPVVSLIGYWNMKLARFCDECSAPLYPNHWLNWLIGRRHCSKCGVRQNAVKPLHLDELSDDALQ